MQGEQLSLFDDFNDTPVVPSPFLGRKVTITGTFSQGRQALRSVLLRLGATEVRYDKLQRSTHFFLVGDNPSADVLSYHRLYVHDGYNIRYLSVLDLQRIQAGEYAPYQVSEEITKELHLTREHLYWKAPEISEQKSVRAASPVALDSMSVLYGMEIFVHVSIMHQMPELAQALGCLGAYSNTEIDDDTDCILISHTMPKEICDAVETHYNKARATQFNTPFIILEDLIEYLKRRVAEFPDNTLSSLLDRVLVHSL